MNGVENTFYEMYARACLFATRIKNVNFFKMYSILLNHSHQLDRLRILYHIIRTSVRAIARLVHGFLAPTRCLWHEYATRKQEEARTPLTTWTYPAGTAVVFRSSPRDRYGDALEDQWWRWCLTMLLWTGGRTSR